MGAKSASMTAIAGTTEAATDTLLQLISMCVFATLNLLLRISVQAGKQLIVV